MRIVITTMFIVLSTIICWAQTDTTAIPFVSYWDKGDSYDFQITKLKQQWKDGQMVKNDSSAYIVNFEVIDSTATSYTIKWSYKTDLKAYDIPEELMERFSKYDMTEVIYTTTETGTFVGIENWEEISEMMNGMFRDIIDVFGEKEGMDKAKFEQVMTPMMTMYQSKEAIEQVVFKELQYFHYPLGVEFGVQEPIYYEDRLPNMFGGAPIKANGKLYFREIKRDNSYCVLVDQLNLDPEDTKSMLLNFFKKIGLSDAEVEEGMKEAVLEINDLNIYQYFYDPGIPVHIETKRNVLFEMTEGATKSTEVLRIELLLND